MAKEKNIPTPVQQKRWIGGISDYLKESAIPDAYFFGISVDYRTDPQSLTLLPGPINESGSVVTDLLKWGDTLPKTNITSFFYGDLGNIYQRTGQGDWTYLHTATGSHGNGMAYFVGDNYLYYATDTNLGRYGPISTAFFISENWSQGLRENIWFNPGGENCVIENGVLTITSEANTAQLYAVETLAQQDLTGYKVTNQLVNAGNLSLTDFVVVPIFCTRNEQNYYYFAVEATDKVRAYKVVAGVETQLQSATYSSTTHKYFRIYESGGSIFFDTSPDGANWTNFTSEVASFPLTALYIGQSAGTETAQASTTSAVFDNFYFGPLTNNAQFTDNFLRAQGGTPLNTYALNFASASSEYATAADSASLSVTGNITLEAFVKFTTLPAVGSSMTIMGKWDESANTRSYKMDILGVSGYFGDGGSGALTVSVTADQSLTDSTAIAASGSTAITATNASFAAGQTILLHQTQGTNAGQWERTTIQSYTAGTITTATPLLGSYGTGAQVIVIPQYTTITVNSGITWSAKAWNGSVGGILVGLANVGISNSGTISATGRGFRGASAPAGNGTPGFQGEGTAGASGTASSSANGNGGGGGLGAPSFSYSSGGGGSNGTQGTSVSGGNSPGLPGAISGSIDLASMTFGGGGGSGGAGDNSNGGAGGNGGGIIFLSATTITNITAGVFVSNGANGSAATVGADGNGGGAGAGGSILLKAQTATLLASNSAAGGVGGAGHSGQGQAGGNGGAGRVAVYYLSSIVGSSTPTLHEIQDNSLVTTTTYQMRLGLSSNGTNSEFLAKNIPTLTTGTWNRYSITWQASLSTANFYVNAQSIGSTIGTFTAVNNNASLFYLAADKAAAVGKFVNGTIDDVRVWNNVQTAAQIDANNVTQLTGNEGGLQAYWKLNNAATDSTANANTLTLVNTPTYTTDVPFPDATTRLDIDLSQSVGGSTYSLGSTISEVTADMLDFTPTKDPQSSVSFVVSAKGTGNWTVLVHDTQNRVVATETIAAAEVPSSGLIEFVYDDPWRTVDGKQYHMHLYSSDGTGSIESGTLNNIDTATYKTYFQFLVTDTDFHPIVPFLNYMIVGNERYLATWDGAFYQPNQIVFPPGTRVRALSFWREFLAIGVWKGDTITDFDQGKIYFWDGSAPTFNFFIDVPQGQIAALYGKDSDLYMFAGFRGVLMKYTGGGLYTNGNSAASKLKRIPKIEPADYVDVYPGALTMWRDLVHFGIAANAVSDTITRATYSWGSLNQLYPETLSCDYPLSTGSTGDTVSIGLTFPIGQSLIVGWRDGVATGADVINFDNPPASEGYIQTLVKDDDALWKDKLNFDVRADHLALEDGESIEVGISVDRGDFTIGGVTSDSELFTKMPVSSGRAREYQLSLYMYATGETSPTVLGLGVLHSDTSTEQQW
jgi:hypothetical protein